MDSEQLLKQLELDIQNCTNPKFIEIDEVYGSEIVEIKDYEEESQPLISGNERIKNGIKNY